ncbi:hypothetical protein MKZ38_010339 [Zalerion maritima]|uniref:Uncharacterized protein n=1 Tax=Zalerion maritima TaxID=339359 RepID=A0AAD5RY75_9PEZI|nr:hypothetical protein MKZ38_010339 [Zalerion maritima]
MSDLDSDTDSLFGDSSFLDHSSPFMEDGLAGDSTPFTNSSTALPTPSAAVAPADHAPQEEGRPLPTLYCKDAPSQGHHVSTPFTGTAGETAQTLSKGQDKDDILEQELLAALQEDNEDDQNASDHPPTESRDAATAPSAEALAAATATAAHLGADASAMNNEPGFQQEIRLNLPLQNVPTNNGIAGPINALMPLRPWGDGNQTNSGNQSIPYMDIDESLQPGAMGNFDWLTYTANLCPLAPEQVDLGAFSDDAPVNTIVNRRLDLPGDDVAFLIPYLKHAKKRKIDLLVNSMRLPTMDRHRFHTRAKEFVLASGSRSPEDSEEDFKLRLLSLGLEFFRDQGYGSEFFKKKPDGSPVGGFCWPEDSTLILYMFCPLLYRLVSNERQRRYALEQRKAARRQKAQEAANLQAHGFTLLDANSPNPLSAPSPSDTISGPSGRLSREPSSLSGVTLSVEPPIQHISNFGVSSTPATRNESDILPAVQQSLSRAPTPATKVGQQPSLPSPIVAGPEKRPSSSFDTTCSHLSPVCQHECGHCAGRDMAMTFFCYFCISSGLPQSRPVFIPSVKPGEGSSFLIPSSLAGAGSKITIENATSLVQEPHRPVYSTWDTPSRSSSIGPQDSASSAASPPCRTLGSSYNKGTKRKAPHDESPCLVEQHIGQHAVVSRYTKLKYVVNFMRGTYSMGLSEFVFDHSSLTKNGTSSAFDVVYGMVPMRNEITKISVLTGTGIQEVRSSEEWDKQVANVWEDDFMGDMVKVRVDLPGPR